MAAINRFIENKHKTVGKSGKDNKRIFFGKNSVRKKMAPGVFFRKRVFKPSQA